MGSAEVFYTESGLIESEIHDRVSDYVFTTPCSAIEYMTDSEVTHVAYGKSSLKCSKHDSGSSRERKATKHSLSTKMLLISIILVFRWSVRLFVLSVLVVHR